MRNLIRKKLGKFIEWAISYNHEILIEMDHLESKIPVNANGNDAGYDIFTTEEVTIPPNGKCLVKTNIKVHDPDQSLWFELSPRSSNLMKHGLRTVRGIIDTSYGGYLFAAVENSNNEEFTIPVGMRIPQLIPHRNIPLSFKLVEKLPSTRRGSNGFGSSGN